MSIVRIGLGETKGFHSGYDAIFGGKKKPTATAEAKPAVAAKPKAKKPAAKKPAKKK